MIKAIIFDLDGVIILSELPRFKAIQKAAADNKIVISDTLISKSIGKTTLNFLNEIFTEEEKKSIRSIMKDYTRDYTNNILYHVKPVDFVVEFIRNYHGITPLALASINLRKKIDKFLNFYTIQSKFEVILSEEDVVNYKPHPEIYLQTAKRLNVPAKDCVVIEDSVIGVQAALDAKMSCFVLLNGYNKESDFKGEKIQGFIRTEQDLAAIIGREQELVHTK